MRMKIFRWKAIGPLLLLLVLIGVLLWLFAEPIAGTTGVGVAMAAHDLIWGTEEPFGAYAASLALCVMAGALGMYLRSVFRNQFMNPYVG